MWDAALASANAASVSVNSLLSTTREVTSNIAEIAGIKPYYHHAASK
jgi:hypothetical protein